MPTMATESKAEVEEFLLDKFQSNLMRSLVDGDGFWDVALHLGREGSGTAIVNCHRHMLAAHSPVFAQLCHQAQTGSTSVPGKIPRISMRVECDPDAWSDIQTYMYTGRLSVRPEHAIEALSVCTFYQIEPLVRAYSLFSESYLKIDSVNVLLASALQFDLRESVERCENFILRNGSQTLLNPTFEAVPEHEVCRLLSFDTLEILEVEAFLAAVKWGKARFPQDSNAALKMRLRNIMQYVRFPLMDSKDMAETVEPLGLVDEQLILEAYRFKATGGDSSSRSHEANQFRRFIPRRPPTDHNLPRRQTYALPSLNSTLPRQSTLGGGGGSTGGVDSLSYVAMKESFRASSRASSRTGYSYAAAAPTSGAGGPMVGVGLGLSLHSSLPCMVVTEVATWCIIQGGDLITIEVGDLLKSIDGWAIVRNVDEVKRNLLGPPGTSVRLGIQRRGQDYTSVLVRGSSDRVPSRGASGISTPRDIPSPIQRVEGGGGGGSLAAAGPALARPSMGVGQIDMKRQLEEARNALSNYSRQSITAPSQPPHAVSDGVQQERMQDYD